MIILGIETSCDETAAAVIKARKNSLEVLSSAVSSQIKLHARWGGVVPNLAAREHLKNIAPVVQQALRGAAISPSKIDLIAVTRGPGLIPALLVGTTAAKTLSFAWQKPLLGISHMEGHIYANLIGKSPESIKFPLLCLTVSGGHTQLVLMKNHLNYKIIGETLDDAAGEAFDKVARILGLGYPGGPAIAACANKSSTSYKLKLPRPMLNSKDFNFSFSGLKTAVLYAARKHNNRLKNKEFIRQMCREFQQAVIDVLVAKTIKAAQKYKPRSVMLAGGVSANIELRKQLGKAVRKFIPGSKYHMPELRYSIDNAAMIAAAAHYQWSAMGSNQKKRALNNWKKIQTDANLKLT